MTNSIIGSIKFFNEAKNFGFVSAGGHDHFFNQKKINDAGFRVSDMENGATVEFVPETSGGKLRVAQFICVGGLQARSAPTPVEVGQTYIGLVEKYNADHGYGFLKVEGHSNVFFHISVIEGLAAPVVNGVYRFSVAAGKQGPVADCVQAYCRTQVDAHEGKKLFSIKLDGYIAYYEVENASGTVEYLSTTSLSKAREAIGKIIRHQPAAGHGEKTNVVRPRHDGQKKKEKKAA